VLIARIKAGERSPGYWHCRSLLNLEGRLTCHLVGKPHGIRSPSDDTSQMLGDSSPFLISVSAPEFAIGRIYADAGDDRSVSRAIVVRACSTRRHAEPKSPRISDRLDRQVPARVVLDPRKQLRERDGLSAGGSWIRTFGSARDRLRFKPLSLVGRLVVRRIEGNASEAGCSTTDRPRHPV